MKVCSLGNRGRVNRVKMRLVSLYVCAVLFVLVAVSGAGAARILALFPIPGRSHFIVTSSLARALAERGHEVVVASPFTTSKPPPTYRDLSIPDPLENMGKTDFFSLGNMPAFGVLIFMWSMGIQACDLILKSDQIQKLIKSQEIFDLVLTEAFFNDCMVGFAHRFNAPIVQISAFHGAPWMADWMGSPTNPSYLPDPLLHFSDHLTFTQRLSNLALGVMTTIGRSLYLEPRMDAAMREGFGDPTMPHLSDLLLNTSLLLVNSHFSIAPPRPAVPAYVQVGGLHIPKPKALPEELRKWLEAAPGGFVYFSLGSNVRSADMPPEKRDAILRAFASLSSKGIRVLWKWEESALPGKPDNVRIEKWLPQPDILAHPKCRVFVTHGGLMSTQEAVYHGVPLIGIPIFGDQELNMGRASAAGFGLPLKFQDVTEETLSVALERVLGDSAYRESARRLSSIFHDRPMAPMDEAVFWTEYVIRHKGAHHMRSAAVGMPLYQYLLLDVLAFVASVFFVSALVSFYVLRLILRRLFGSRASKAKESSKKRN